MQRMAEQNKIHRAELEKLRKENVELKRLAAEEPSLRDDMVKDKVEVLVRNEVKSWKEEREQQKVDMKEILKQQQEEHDRQMETKVVKIIKEKEQIVRDTVQKKMCVMVFGDKEKHQPWREARERD